MEPTTVVAGKERKRIVKNLATALQWSRRP